MILAVPEPPARRPEVHENEVALAVVLPSVIKFPLLPAVVAVTRTVKPNGFVATTPTLLPFPGRWIAATMFAVLFAWVSVPANVVPEFTAPAVRVKVVPNVGLAIVIVSPLVKAVAP